VKSRCGEREPGVLSQVQVVKAVHACRAAHSIKEKEGLCSVGGDKRKGSFEADKRIVSEK
jgi:hypothetical protein